jgi:hypothetical protein
MDRLRRPRGAETSPLAGAPHRFDGRAGEADARTLAEAKRVADAGVDVSRDPAAWSLLALQQLRQR